MICQQLIQQLWLNFVERCESIFSCLVFAWALVLKAPGHQIGCFLCLPLANKLAPREKVGILCLQRTRGPPRLSLSVNHNILLYNRLPYIVSSKGFVFRNSIYISKTCGFTTLNVYYTDKKKVLWVKTLIYWSKTSYKMIFLWIISGQDLVRLR